MKTLSTKNKIGHAVYLLPLIYAAILISSSPGIQHVTTGLQPTSKTVATSQSPAQVHDTLAGIRESLKQNEYGITFDATTGNYQGPNRAQELRSCYRSGRWTIQPRNIQKKSEWSLQMNTSGIYADGHLLYKAAPDIVPALKGNTIEFSNTSFTEQYINTAEGIRQNFIIKQAPAHTQKLSVKLAIKGMTASQGTSGTILLTKDAQKLTYSGLKAWDADGKPVTATMQLDNQELELLASVDHARFPVTIDPIIASGNTTNANTVLESNQVSSSMSASVSGAGDVNGDGYSDILVGAPSYDKGQFNEGVVFLYYGSSTGINTTPVILEMDQSMSSFGQSVSNAGDLNGDGYGDIIIGAPAYEIGPETDEGAAFVYYGSATGISNTPVSLQANLAGAAMGTSVSGAGDVNGDGYSDVIAGVPYYANGGALFFYYGAAGGIGTSPSAIRGSNVESAGLGQSVSAAGDINGDGYSDIIAGTNGYSNGQPNEGAAYIYLGSSGGIGTVPTILEANQSNSYFGYTVSGAGDVNGDGYSDVIVGAFYYDNGQTDEGAAFIYHGAAGGINTTPAIMLESNQAAAMMGTSVSDAGDVNGDGYSDILVGSPWYDNGQGDEGILAVYHGGPGGISSVPASVIEGDQSDLQFATSASSAGDVNGDGFSDIITGTQRYSNGQASEGAAFVYHGANYNSGKADATTPLTLMYDTAYTQVRLGYAVADAGDVNGDGYSDMMVTSIRYNYGVVLIYYGSANGISQTPGTVLSGNNTTNTEFGCSASKAGDVNGDGYGDIIVGAHWYNNGQFDEGAALVYYGSATGINSNNYTALESNTPGAELGLSVSGAGDLNGDGYSDVIVGAPNYTNGQSREGAVYIFYGAATGAVTTPAVMLESNAVFEMLGYSVSGAGDINGDGYDDVMAGAYNYANKGGVYLFYGTASGVSNTPSRILVSNQQNSGFGMNVAKAGDVNADGYSDVVIGAIDYNINSRYGAAFVFYGSATGLRDSTIIQSVTPYTNYQIYQVAGAGDVNRDGYADIVLGAANSSNTSGITGFGGLGYICYGSPAGINPALQVFGNNQNSTNLTTSRFANSVSGAGDLNGDGYSDVVFGAPYYTGTSNLDGAAFVYMGNSNAANKTLQTPRLFNTGTTTLLQRSNIQFNNFTAGMFARNPEGRSKAKLIWETRRQGQAFSSASLLSNSTQFSGQSAYADLGINGAMLTGNPTKPGYSTRIRVRTKYSPVTSQNGQVYGPWIYLQEPFSIRANSVALPVTLVVFTATVVDNIRVRTEWITAIEKDNDYFTVEHSADAIHWEEVSTVKSKDNLSARQSYQAYDEHPYQGISYYRLKQTAIDGSSTYSETRTVNIGTSGSRLYISPNPTTGILTIQGPKEDFVQLSLFNATGQNVTAQVQVQHNNDHQYTLDLTKIAPGNYFLQTATTTSKIVKQ